VRHRFYQWYERRSQIHNWFGLFLYDLGFPWSTLLINPSGALTHCPIVVLHNQQRYHVPSDQLPDLAGFLHTAASYLEDMTCYFPELQLSAGDVIIDIGAHIGSFALPTMLRTEGLTCHCFEPNPLNFEVLRRNAELNGLAPPRLVCHRQALYDHDGIIDFATGMTSTTGSVGEVNVYKLREGKPRYFARNEIVHNQTMPCESITLENLFAANSIASCKLLKLDCEGAEYRALFHAPESVLPRVAYLIIEAHPTDSHQPAELKAWLAEHQITVHERNLGNGCFMYYCRNDQFR